MESLKKVGFKRRWLVMTLVRSLPLQQNVKVFSIWIIDKMSFTVFSCSADFPFFLFGIIVGPCRTWVLKIQAGAPADDVEEGWIQQLEFLKKEVGKMVFAFASCSLFLFCVYHLLSLEL